MTSAGCAKKPQGGKGIKLHSVIAGLVPAIPLRDAVVLPYRGGRNKLGHDKDVF